jgi:hypothetical protein
MSKYRSGGADHRQTGSVISSPFASSNWCQMVSNSANCSGYVGVGNFDAQ